MRAFVFAALGVALELSLVVPSQAEVRFGRNVRVGGHDFSNQTFNSRRRAEIYLHEGQPRRAGCRWTRAADGARVKVCHLKTLRH
jgi:hypothetical protein